MKFFLSSTYEDLSFIRCCAINYLRNICGNLKTPTGDVIAMEFFNASDIRCKEHCLDELKKCDVVIGIYGERYGTRDDETNLSMTEIEFDYACSHDIPVLAFVLNTQNREDNETTFLNDKVFKRNKMCAKFSSDVDFVERLNDSLTTYFGSFDGYSFESLWSEVSELQREIQIKIQKNTPGLDLQMMPYSFGQENDAIESIVFSSKCIGDFVDSLNNTNAAIYTYAYKFKHSKVSKEDKEDLCINVQEVSSDVLANWEIINVGINNHTKHIILAAMFLKLYNMHMRLLTENWSEELKKQVIAVREEYKRIIESSYYVD